LVAELFLVLILVVFVLMARASSLHPVFDSASFTVNHHYLND